MRKIRHLAIAAILACFSMIWTGAQAYAFSDGISVFVNGYPIQLSYPAAVENGRVLVPFRDIFEALGLEASWDGSTNTVSGGDVNSWVSFVLGENTATVNGKTIELDVPARAVDGHTLVPVRFVGESTGFGADWDQLNQRVIVGDGNIHGDILLTSSHRNANAYQLYDAGQGIGEFAGLTKVLGYPGDDEFAVYYQNSVDGQYQSLVVKYEDLRGLDPSENIRWQYQGKSFINTRGEVYKFCRDASSLASLLGMNTYDAIGLFSPQWLLDTFEQVYLDCQRGWLFEQDMVPIAEGYIDSLNGTIGSNGHRDSMALTPDAVFVPATEEDGWIKERYLSYYGLSFGFDIIPAETSNVETIEYLINTDTNKKLTLGSTEAVYRDTSGSGVSINGVKIKIDPTDSSSLCFYKQDLIDVGLIVDR